MNDRLNLGLKANEVALVFRDMDKDGSGTIDVKEFLRTMRSQDFAENYDPWRVRSARELFWCCNCCFNGGGGGAWW